MIENLLDAATDELSDAAMLGNASRMNEEEWLLVRNRILISWLLWIVCISAMIAVLAGWSYLPNYEIMVASFIVFQVTRFLRACRRPKIGRWELRRHWYTFTYKLVPLTGILVMLWWDAPVPLGGWVGFGMPLYLLYQVQIKDDIKILKAIPRIIKLLKERA